MANVLVLFRNDLRISHNPALYYAAQDHRVLPVYILDDDSIVCDLGGANKVWLHQSLLALDKSLGNQLHLYRGHTQSILERLVQECDISAIYWNRRYTPYHVEQDKAIKAYFKGKGISVHSYKANLLREPWECVKSDGNPYVVFTPFYKKNYLSQGIADQVLPVPDSIAFVPGVQATQVDDLKLLTHKPWEGALLQHWTIGENAARSHFLNFIDDRLPIYKDGRNFPAQIATSELSPHLRFGEIAPLQIYSEISNREQDHHTLCFYSELVWREFAYHMLYHFPHMLHTNYNKKFDAYPWEHDPKIQELWHKGMTGIPIIDAGMRQLWQTGTMHNRVRMIVGSFLIKNLNQHWKAGLDWFHDCLMDADPASNSFNWQWVAGCGADAAPYFRIFNPLLQSQKFDADARYIKQYIPELKNLSVPYVFAPWKAPAHILSKAQIVLGATYPYPIVGLGEARNMALAHYKVLSGQRN